jgi:hypothetical protein
VERETGGAKRGVLLLVDEIVNLLDAKPGAPLLATLGGLLDTFTPSQLNLVVTTLDAVWLNALTTKSGRRIHWAPLSPLSQEATERLFLLALRRVDATATALPPAVRITISDAAGHLRSLQYVMEAMLELGSTGSRDLAALRVAVLERMGEHLRPTFRAMKAALRGVPVRLGSTPLQGEGVGVPDGRTLRELIAAGVFINTDATGDADSHVVPKLSMLRLLLFSKSNADSGLTSAERIAARCIGALADSEVTGAAASPRATLTGAPFEGFVAHWLRLMAVVRAGEPLTVLRLFHAGTLDDDAGPSGQLTAAFTLDGVAAQPVVNSPRRFTDTMKAGELRAAGGGMIATFGDSNPAFDVLLTAPCSSGDAGHRVPPGDFVAVAVEARMSAPGRTMADEDVARKCKLFAQLRPAFQRMRPPPAHVAYVYAAVRPVKDAAAQQRRLAAEGILLLCNAPPGEDASLATVHRALTPTLSGRAFFLLSLNGHPRPAGSPAGLAAGDTGPVLPAADAAGGRDAAAG